MSSQNHQLVGNRYLGIDEMVRLRQTGSSEYFYAKRLFNSLWDRFVLKWPLRCEISVDSNERVAGVSTGWMDMESRKKWCTRQ